MSTTVFSLGPFRELHDLNIYTSKKGFLSQIYSKIQIIIKAICLFWTIYLKTVFIII